MTMPTKTLAQTVAYELSSFLITYQQSDFEESGKTPLDFLKTEVYPQLTDSDFIPDTGITFTQDGQTFSTLAKGERLLYVDADGVSVYSAEISFPVDYQNEQFVATVSLRYTEEGEHADDGKITFSALPLTEVFAEIERKKTALLKLLTEQPSTAFQTLKDLSV